MTDPERFMEQQIESGADIRTLILLACTCAKVAVTVSAKDECLLFDALRACWEQLNGRGDREQLLEIIRRERKAA